MYFMFFKILYYKYFLILIKNLNINRKLYDFFKPLNSKYTLLNFFKLLRNADKMFIYHFKKKNILCVFMENIFFHFYERCLLNTELIAFLKTNILKQKNNILVLA